MRRVPTFRPAALLALLPVLALGVSTGAQQRRPLPGPPTGPGSARPAEASRLAAIQRHENPGMRAPHGEHLAEWMSRHSNLTPQEQQQALDREPGFRDLPPATQQRMHDRLAQLNAMTPQRRQRLLAENEAMEHLSPPQRAQVRGAMQQLGSLPLDQRRMVARTFRRLRDLPPDQRPAAASMEAMRGQFNEAQRNTLENLLRIEPMLPPPASAAPLPPR